MSDLSPQPILRASDFAESIGVCAHLYLTQSSYGNVSAVQSQLSYIGVDHVRAETPNLSQLAPYQVLGAAGVKFDLIEQGDPVKYLPSFDALAPYIQSIEGPNEVNVTPVTYNGLTGAAAVIALQKAIYAAVHADPLLNGNGRYTPVLDFTVAYGGDLSIYGDTSAYADYTNVHAYARFGVPSAWFSQQAIASVGISHDLPVIVTETGNYTMAGGGSAVSMPVQAKLMTYTLLDDFKHGVAMTYVYQLEDGNADTGAPYSENHYGLFTVDGTAKSSAVALHDLTTILKDNAAMAATFTPSPVAYTVAGLPYYGNQMALQKSDGTLDIALWQEQAIWDSTNGVEIVNPANTVTVTLGQVYQTVNVYDPILGTTPVATYHNVNTVQVALGNDAMIVEVMPDAPGHVIDTGIAGGTFASTGADTVIGGLGNAVVNVSSNATVTGGAGTLTINLSGGGASVLGGNGALTVKNAGSNETVTGGSGAFRYSDTGGNNTITTGTSASNTVALGAGSDTVNVRTMTSLTAGSGMASVLLTGSGNTVTGSSGGLTVTDTAGGNTVTGGAGAFILTHTLGNDLITTGTSASNTLVLGAGNDAVNVRGATKLTGGAGSATVVLNASGSSITGGSGSTTVIDNSRANTVIGGAGTFSYSNAVAGAADAGKTVSKVLLGTGTAGVTLAAAASITGGSGAATVTLNGAGGTVVGGTGALTVIGNSSGNTVTGGTGTFTYTSAAGSNLVTTGTSASQVKLGSGTDTVNVVGATMLTAGSGKASLVLGSSGSTIVGGSGTLVVTDTRGGNTITGGSAAMTVTASAGSDVITTNNTSGISLVTLTAGSHSVMARGTTSVSGGAASLVVGGTGILSVNGGSGSMTVNGGTSADWVFTQTNTRNLINLGSGTDTVLSHGADTISASTATGALAEKLYIYASATITGGAGTLAIGGTGVMSVTGGVGAVNATASASGSYVKGGSAGGNVLVTAAGNTTLVGAGAGDRLSDTGSAGGNLLQAGAGGNTLTAGVGNDTLVGATGSDIFVLAKAASAHSTVIQGYIKGSDTLSFTGFGTAAPIASQQVVGNNLQLTLADASNVTLIGVSSF